MEKTARRICHKIATAVKLAKGNAQFRFAHAATAFSTTSSSFSEPTVLRAKLHGLSSFKRKM